MKSNVAVKKCLLILITVLFIMAFGALFVACAPKGSEDSNDHEHLYRYYTYNNDATCGRDGTETATCEFCTKTDTRPCAAHPATGNHTYNTNNVCTVCGHIKSSGDNNDDTKKYKTVTFDAGDGETSVSEKQFEVGKVMADLPVPTREGYRFVCWYNPIHGEFTSASIMPNVDFTVIAQWEKAITQYEDDYVLFKPATQGVKSAIIYDLYHSDVDKFVYVELTSDDIGGVASVGTENNFTLRTLESMQYSIKSGYNWAWYQGNFNNPNGAQRFTLRYGSNVQFVTISDGSGVVVQTYLVDIYVRRDYYVSLYKNIFEDQPYDKVRVIENDRFPSSTATASEGDFEFDKRVYYNSSTRAYESFVYSTAITQNLNLYQTYKPVTLNATLNGGSVNGALTVTPYEKYFELPTATKDGYDFMGWKLSDGKYLTDINGFGGDKYYSKDTAVLSISAEFARTKFYYTFENDELRTQKTVPVVTYTDNTNSEIAEILHVPDNTDCALPTKSPDTTQAIFKGWQQYAKKNGGGYYTTPSDFDFNVKVTEPIALVPECTGTLVNDPSSDIYQSAIAINSQNSYSARGTFKMYLPAKEEYTLIITPTSRMQITVNSYGKESAKSYTISAGSPYSIKLNYYVYNYGSQVRAKGEVSFNVISGSGSFTAELVGSTGETDGRPIKLTDDNLANVGENFTVNAEKAGYTFVGWYNGETELTNELSYTFAMPSSNVTYTAKWIKVTVDRNNTSAGTVTSLTGKYKVGDSTTITATTNSGYTFVGWYNGTTKLTNELSYTFAMPSSNVTYMAKWIKVTVDRNDASAGTVTSLTGTYKVGDSVTVTATTNIGYTFVGWYNGTTKLTNELSYTFAMPSSNVTYTAKWTYYTLTTSTNDSSAGSYTQKTAVKITAGQTVTVTATTNSGYTWVGWYNGETELTKELSYTFAMPSSNVTYTAKWIICPVTLEKNTEAAGSVSMPSTSIVGQNTTITATTNSGYTFVGWYNGETELTNELSYTFAMPSSNVTYTAKWEERREYLDEVFEYTLTDGKCTITGIKDKSVTEISVPGYVDKILQGAFSGCSNLTSITLPFVGGSIRDQYPFGYIFGSGQYIGGTNISQSNGSSTVSYCIPTSLESVTITGGDILCGAFHNCSSLTSITIPNSVTSIGDYAFRGCRSLTSITIPNSVTSIGDDAFYGCRSLTSITVPNSVTSIGKWAFYECSSLTSITIPFVGASKNGTSNTHFGYIFGAGSYSDNSYAPKSLKTVIVTGGTSIVSMAFAHCSSLTSITIPSSVTSIGGYAFEYCGYLTSITIPNSVTSIGNDVFYGCGGLTIYCEAASKPSGWSINWNSANYPVIWNCKNNDKDSNGYAYAVIDGIRYNLKDSIATVIRQPSNLRGAIAIPASVTYKGVGYSVTSIKHQAFAGCSSLTSIEIPNSVTSIDRYVFSGCSSLTIYCEAIEQPSGWDSYWNDSCPVIWDCKNK